VREDKRRQARKAGFPRQHLDKSQESDHAGQD